MCLVQNTNPWRNVLCVSYSGGGGFLESSSGCCTLFSRSQNARGWLIGCSRLKNILPTYFEPLKWHEVKCVNKGSDVK
jgi:hypothetical protein